MSTSETGTSASQASVTIERRIEWMDTDAAGQHHNTAIVRLVEAAEALLHTRLGIAGETFGRTPRVRSEMNFRARLRFNDRVSTTLWVEEMGRTSLRYGFTVHNVTEDGQHELVADGALVIVAFSPEQASPVEWPAHHRRLLLTAGTQIGETLHQATTVPSQKGDGREAAT